MENQKQNKTECLKARITQEELEMINKYMKENKIKNRTNLIRFLVIDKIKKEMEEKE